MANINKMSIREIFNVLGTSIESDQLVQVVKDVTELLEYLERDKKAFEKINQIAFIEECGELIDKERLACAIGKNLKKYLAYSTQKELNQTEKKSYNTKEKQFKKCLELLEHSRAELPVFECNDELYSIKEFYSVNDLFDRKKDAMIKTKEKNSAIFQKAEEEGILFDLVQACIYQYGGLNLALKHSEMGNIIGQLLLFNSKKIMKKQDKLSNKEKTDIIAGQLKEFFEAHIEKINIDKFLLVSAYTARKFLETRKVDDKSGYIKILQFANENIEDRKLRISSNLTESTIKYSVKELEEDNAKILSPDVYVNEKQKAYIKQCLLEGKYKSLGAGEVTKTIIEQEWSFLNLLEITEKEKKQIIANNNFNNIERLYKIGFLDKDDIQEWLGQIEDKKLEIEFVDYLYNDGAIQKHNFIDLYMARNLKLSEIIDMDVLYDINFEVTVEELMDYYFQATKDNQKEKKFDRYALLFKALKLKNQDENYKSTIGDQIVEEMIKRECDNNSDWKKLYKADLLPIRTLIDWNGEKIIYDLIEENLLKPQDTKELLISGALDIDRVYETLENCNLSDAQKLNFIFSSFDGSGRTPDEVEIQNEARNKLLQIVNISNTVSTSNSGNGTTNSIHGPKKQTNKFLINPAHRWQLFYVVDKDLTAEACIDGTIIFTLPNVENGTVVIEKILKNTKQGNKLDYGAATYIMSEEEFLNNRSNIISNNKVNRNFLSDMYAKKRADKALHSLSWGKQIKEKLHTHSSDKYTEKEKDEIDELISKIKETRELIR